VVPAEDLAQKAGIETRRRAYESVELKILIRQAVSEAASLVREIDHNNEYSAAVGLHPRNGHQTGPLRTGIRKTMSRRNLRRGTVPQDGNVYFLFPYVSCFKIVYFDFMLYVKNVKESSKGLELGGDGS